MTDKLTKVNTPVRITTTTNASFLNWDNLYWLSQFALVVFAGLALVSGAVVNKRQSKQLLTLATNLEEQREKTALAEKTALQLEKLLREPRSVDVTRAHETLGKAPTGAIEILFTGDGIEPGTLAQEVADQLKECGWTILKLNPLLSGAGIAAGMTIMIPADAEEVIFDEKLPEPANTLHKFLKESVLSNPAVAVFKRNPKDSELQLLIGPKY